MASRIITVRDGLPQSYVSGIYQDNNGFLWIATLNGLGRYDGRGFKTYQHTTANINGLSGNIILHLFYAGINNLLVCYIDGKIDMLNTVTEKVTHLWQAKSFEALVGDRRYFKSLVHQNNGICWMMNGNGTLFKIDPVKKEVTHFNPAELKLNEPVIGIAVQDDKLLLLTHTRLFICNSDADIIKSMPYPFKAIALFGGEVNNIYSPAIRPNGDLIITDAQGITVWNPGTGFYKKIPVLRSRAPGKLAATFDHAGNYYFECNKGIYVLRADNSVVRWSPAAVAEKSIPTNMYTDRSGVLWVGTNGFGLRQYNLLKTGLPGYRNNSSFVGDVLMHYKIPAAQIAATFLRGSVPFANRSATYKDSVWVADANIQRADPQLVLFANNTITVKTFRITDVASKTEDHAVSFLTFNKQGKLWAIDRHFQLMRLNTQRSIIELFARVDTDPNEEINGMVADGEYNFYISTNKTLVRFDALTGHTEKLTQVLPSKDLLYITSDPDDYNILWIGTLSDGLIRFNKITRRSQLFNIATGLPNNTIYSVLPGKNGLLWCSSNKGIFAFNKNDHTVRSFTSRDGLIDDEFNRYYYIVLPNGNFAFGGPQGYTIFDPANLETDNFDPQIGLTGMDIINMPPITTPLNNVNQLHLRYDQNFITATFAAMQFDFPEKLQYRYMLKDLDRNWITPGYENKVAYTSLPPGNYTLLLNATNTAGKWSKYVRKINISISTPFWRTWWFYLAMILAVVIIIYLYITVRIRGIRSAQTKTLQFEREAMQLHAMALRARMNPHFIFNCLNSIKALIQEKHDQKAVNYLTTFATLIRKQLNNTSNEITLNDELETCKLYLELEAMRFEDRIAFKFDIADNETLGQINVPPLILQPIVENAIVHGLLPAEHRGLVTIKVYQDGGDVVCEIQDNGIGRAAAAINKEKSSRLHYSKGIYLLEERISMHNRLNDSISSLNIVDLYYPDGKPSGTLVIIKFNVTL